MTSNETTALQHKAAADEAFAATLWEDAAREYEAALSLDTSAGAGPVLDEPEILTRLGSCYWSMSQARTAWRTLRRAMQLYRERGDGPGLAQATVEVLRIWGPWERQLAMADDALELLGPDGDPYLRARLLLATAWRGRNDRFLEAMEIGRTHNFEDILVQETQTKSHEDYHATGDIDALIATAMDSFEIMARLDRHEPACGILRQTGFGTIEHGQLDRGVEIARQCVDYARKVHLRFHEELALCDIAGVHFGRADYAACNATLDELTTNTDFRADLYRMWIVERSGDTKAAVQMMVDPERAGRAATGMSQTHGAAAGVLFRAGITDPAKREFEQWAEIAGEHGELAYEAPVLFEAIAAFADDALLTKICDAYVTSAERDRPPTFAVLSGRASAPAHGAFLLRLNRIDEAERVYSEGLAMCERERLPIDAALCLRGLAAVASNRGDEPTAEDLNARANTLLEQHNANLYLQPQ